MTTLSITPLDNKKAFATGIIVVVEPCQVVVKGYGSSIADLRVRMCVKGREVARFPLVEGDAWENVDGDAVCTVNTNTVQGRAVFQTRSCSCDLETKDCLVIVEDIQDSKALICSLRTSFKNWPQVDGEDVPYDLEDFPDTVAALEASIAALQAEFDAHDHDTDDPTQVDHTDLANIGTNTHDQIDAAITALQASVGTAEDEIDTLQTEMDAAEASIAGHNHNGSGSQILSHAGLSGIGTRTHAQLESDTAAVVSDLSDFENRYDAHAHTGSDGSLQVVITNIDGWTAEEARIAALEASVLALTNALAALDAEVVKKQTTLYTVTAPVSGAYRNISEDMTGDQLAAAIPTIVADLKTMGVL